MRRMQLATALTCGGAAVVMALYDNRVAAVLFILAYVNFMVAHYDRSPGPPTRKESSDD